MNLLRAAIFYFAGVFAFAFVLGMVRNTLVTPLVGPMIATILEIPLVLTASWAVAHRLVRHHAFDVWQRTAIGVIAFALLMLSEIAVSAIIRGASFSQWAAGIATPVGLVGLAGQLGFAAMPITTGPDRFRVPDIRN